MAATKTPPLCPRCGREHWKFVTCDGEHRGASSAREQERARRQDVEVREKVDMPPLISRHQDGFRAFGDRLDSWDRLGGNTLVRKEPR